MPAKADKRKPTQQPTAELTWQQVMAWRLQRHQLDKRAPKGKLIEVVSGICGLHAQLMSSAELSMWARIKDLAPDVVQNALWHDRSLVKTWAMRGTLHLLTADDFPIWQSALSTSASYRKGSWLKYHGVTLDEIEAIIEGVKTTLADKGITREQLADGIAERMKTPKLRELLRSGWGALLKPSAFQGNLCFGPNQGQNVTFVKPERWLKKWYTVPVEEAQQEAFRRYLGAYGPATLEDWTRWFATTPARAKALINELGEAITLVDVEGAHSWMLAQDVEAAAKATIKEHVRLLPAFDPYVVGSSRNSEGLLATKFKDRVHRPQGWISPVLLVDGQMRGVWKHELKSGRLNVEIEPFEKLPPWVREGAEAEAEELARFLGGKLEMSWTSL
ncbi:MAG TPA: winged helix DNA-binding domain-containing protein [Herpetosiphonaceae bacterium]